MDGRAQMPPIVSSRRVCQLPLRPALTGQLAHLRPTCRPASRQESPESRRRTQARRRGPTRMPLASPVRPNEPPPPPRLAGRLARARGGRAGAARATSGGSVAGRPATIANARAHTNKRSSRRMLPVGLGCSAEAFARERGHSRGDAHIRLRALGGRCSPSERRMLAASRARLDGRGWASFARVASARIVGRLLRQQSGEPARRPRLPSGAGSATARAHLSAAPSRPRYSPGPRRA